MSRVDGRPPSPPSATAPDLRFGHPAGALRLPRGPAATQLITAVMCAGPQAFARGWRPCPEGAAFRLGPGRGLIILQAANEAEARLLLSGMSALTLDALLVAMDGLCYGHRWVSIDAADVLAAKGYRRWGVERSAFQRKVLTDLGVFGRLHWRAGGRPAPLFVITTQPQEAGLLVRAGPALSRYLRSGEVHPIARSVLELDHRHNRGPDALAKKLAVALTLRGAVASLRSRDLLVSVGELGGERGESRKARVVDRLRFAAGRLRELDLFDLELGAAPVRTKGWVTKWLQSRVVARPGGHAMTLALSELENRGRRLAQDATSHPAFEGR